MRKFLFLAAPCCGISSSFVVSVVEADSAGAPPSLAAGALASLGVPTSSVGVPASLAAGAPASLGATASLAAGAVAAVELSSCFVCSSSHPVGAASAMGRLSLHRWKTIRPGR
jgi:hypothetical protein